MPQATQETSTTDSVAHGLARSPAGVGRPLVEIGSSTPPASFGPSRLHDRRGSRDRLGALDRLPRPAGLRFDDRAENADEQTPGTLSRPAARPPSVLTIDLEDWPVAVLGPRCAITDRVVQNTQRCLQILQWHGVTATFFILTRVAEQFPDLIGQVAAAGHEIASHGHGHELLTRLSPREFAADVGRSLDILERLTGRRPIGYRAPAFSIVRRTRWAGPILVDLGIQYSSSIFPIRHRRYGIPDAPVDFHRWTDCSLIECPPSAVEAFGGRWPVAGGGWFRLLPGAVVRSAIRQIHRAGRPAVLYMHPYELDPGGVGQHRRDGVRVSPWRELTQELFRSRFERRLHRLLESFRYLTLGECVRRFALTNATR